MSSGQDTQVTQSASPAVTANVDKLVGKVGALSDQPYPVFGQSLYPGLSDTTRGGIGMMTGASGNADFTRGINGALGFTADVAAGNRFGMNDPGYEALRQRAADDAIVASNSPFLSDGTFGTDRHREAVGRGVSGVLAGMDYGNHQNDIARQERAQAALPGLLTGAALPGQMQVQAGQMLDADAIAGRQADYDLFQRQNMGQYDQLARLSSILNGTAGAAGTATTTQSNPGMMDYLGMGIGAAGAFAPLLLSDERAKENIRKVGTTDDGQNIYTYRYKGEPTTQMGLLAQEVAMRKPEAVAQLPSGLLAVDYSKATGA